MQIPDFSRLRILVVGDVMIDRYLTGKVERISPEAPVPVVRLAGEENRLGGAANVALNLRALGVWAGTAGAVGVDENGKVFRGLLAENDLTDALVLDDPERCTTVKTRIISQSQQLMRVDRENTEDLSASAAERLLKLINEELRREPTDLIMFQDYNKGVLSPKIIAGVLQLAGELDIPVVVDPKRENFWNYTGVALFKPNLKEIQQQVTFNIRPVQGDLDLAAAEIFSRLRCEVVMITLSEHGIYVHDGETSAIYPTPARKIADVSGAGDTVISIAAAGLAAGMSLGQVARLANLAGAQVIAKPGVVPIDLEALQREAK